MPKPLTYSVDEAAVLLGISRNTAYDCIRTGRLRAVSLGRRLRVPAGAIEEVLGVVAAGHPGGGDQRTSDIANHVQLVGRLTRDAETRIGRSGQPFCTLRLAIQRVGKDDPLYIDVVVFGPTVDAASEFTKGQLAQVSGRLDQRDWTTEDGQRRSAHQVVAQDMTRLPDRQHPAA